MQVVAVAWQVYLLTHSPVALGLIGLCQAIPRLIFSLMGGVLADMFDRRKMLIVVESTMAVMSTILALCTLLHIIIQLTTPDEFRGRISAVNAMFVIGGPMLGQFESGVVAGFATPQFSVISGGAACIVATLIIAACVPGLLRVKVR